MSDETKFGTQDLRQLFQVWADVYGGYIGQAPFPTVDAARQWILDPNQRGYRQYHRMRICNYLGQDLEVIEAEDTTH